MANFRAAPPAGVSRTVSFAKIFCGRPGRPPPVSWITSVPDVSLAKPIQPGAAHADEATRVIRPRQACIRKCLARKHMRPPFEPATAAADLWTDRLENETHSRAELARKSNRRVTPFKPRISSPALAANVT